MPCPDRPDDFPPKTVIVVLGPTAVGKTELSIRLAERLGGEIVSADSRYFYCGMDIGTAKPTPQELERVPHHLVDVTRPDEPWSLAVFQRAAREAIAGIHQRGNLPILVGGTGQYIRSVIEEWKLPQTPPDPELRAALERWASQIGSDGLHRRLAALDPLAAQKILPGNLRRTIRALEVIFHTGQLFSIQRQKLRSPYRRVLIGLRRPRVELYERIDRRIDEMFAAGFVDEVRGLLEKGYSPGLPTFSAIGYREIIQVLQGQSIQEDAVVQMKRLTRQFVRRQANWFKDTDPEIHWFDMDVETLDRVCETICTAAWIYDPEGIE